MTGSDAVSIATGSPRSWKSSSCRRMIEVSTPRRRWVAATLTIVTPAVGTRAPPGTVSRKLNAPAVPTSVSPSQAARERSNSVVARSASRSSPEAGPAPKARYRASHHPSHSSSRSGLNSVP